MEKTNSEEVVVTGKISNRRARFRAPACERNRQKMYTNNAFEPERVVSSKAGGITRERELARKHSPKRRN